MAKLKRITQKLFGSNSGATDSGKFGSFATGKAEYSKDPEAIQSLSNFLTGWKGAIIADSAPALEDMNALFILAFYQIAYLLQSGVPEYLQGETYYTGDVVRDATGKLYRSVVDANTSPLTNRDSWVLIGGNGGKIELVALEDDMFVRPNPNTSGSVYLMQVTKKVASSIPYIELPPPELGMMFTFKDTLGTFSKARVEVRTMASAPVPKPMIEGLAKSYYLESDYGSWTFVCDGINWFII